MYLSTTNEILLSVFSNAKLVSFHFFKLLALKFA